MKKKSTKELIESNRSAERIVTQISEASLDQQIMNLYLDYRDDQGMTHKQALQATSEELNIADTDILDSLKTSNVQGLSD